MLTDLGRWDAEWDADRPHAKNPGTRIEPITRIKRIKVGTDDVELMPSYSGDRRQQIRVIRAIRVPGSGIRVESAISGDRARARVPRGAG